jgi:hypothetical protein
MPETKKEDPTARFAVFLAPPFPPACLPPTW